MTGAAGTRLCQGRSRDVTFARNPTGVSLQETNGVCHLPARQGLAVGSPSGRTADRLSLYFGTYLLDDRKTLLSKTASKVPVSKTLQKLPFTIPAENRLKWSSLVL